jgi:hypothetical protein
VSADRPQPVIERLTVEEGFLDGLSLSFQPGLNVIIGPRGTGKTSVIELLRFCLGAPALTERFEKGARDHARSILGEGRVTVTCSILGERFVVSRRHIDEAPEGDPDAIKEISPLVLSQNEIEQVGLDARGRTRLLDGFRNGTVDRDYERMVLTSLRSLSAEIAQVNAEILLLTDQLQQRGAAHEALAAAERDLAEREKSVAEAGGALRDLDQLGAVVAERSVTTTILQRTIVALEEWHHSLEEVARARPAVEELPPSTQANPMPTVSQRLGAANQAIQNATTEVSAAVEELRERYQVEQEARRAADDQAREQRRHVESLQEGAGVAAKLLTDLREKAAQLDALQRVRDERSQRLVDLQEQRLVAIGELEALRDQRFNERVAVANDLTQTLSPQIEITVRRSGLASDYENAINDLLRGSGLRYATLSTQLAAKLAPQELVRASEAQDVDLIARAGDISKDRALKVIERVREQGGGKLLSAEIEDAAVFKLLSGGTFKDTTELSTGQRCTVVLPILLHHGDRPVIIDQPEDHLDNAFIVETLVRAIRQRPAESQLIVSTHNPNIPVLGDARQVTVLASDGKRGFEDHTAGLDANETVEAITNIMEGGREAFERRARFYDSHITE